MNRRWQITIVVTTVILTVLVGYLIASPGKPESRARRYLSFKACLLTDKHGIGGKPADEIWAGMEAASLSTRAKVQYQSVYGPDTVANAMPYLNNLIQRHCDVILAVGSSPTGAINSRARELQGIRLAIIDAPTTATNVTSVKATGTSLAPAISRLVTSAVRSAT